MRSLALILLCAACEGPAQAEFPISPQAGSGESVLSGGVDAGTTVVIVGRVCVIDNIVTRNCATTTAGNLNVRLANETAVTAADGTFVIATPTVSTNVLPTFQVDGTNVVTTNQTITAQQALAARAQINVVRQSVFDEMLAVNGIAVVPANTGSVIATVVQNNVPVSGVTVTSNPQSQFGPFFLGTNLEPWTTNSTGVSGIVWFPGLVTTGPAALTFNTLSGGEAIVGGVQVVNGGITMVETVLP